MSDQPTEITSFMIYFFIICYLGLLYGLYRLVFFLKYIKASEK